MTMPAWGGRAWVPSSVYVSNARWRSLLPRARRTLVGRVVRWAIALPVYGPNDHAVNVVRVDWRDVKLGRPIMRIEQNLRIGGERHAAESRALAGTA